MSYASMHAWKAMYSHFLQQLYLQDPPHVYQSTFPSPTQTGQEKNNNGLHPTQSETSPPKTKIKDKKEALPTLRTVPKTFKPRGPPDGAVGALCFSHNISPCHGLRLLQVPAGPYLSRGRGVGILPKGFGVRLLGVWGWTWCLCSFFSGGGGGVVWFCWLGLVKMHFLEVIVSEQFIVIFCFEIFC